MTALNKAGFSDLSLPAAGHVVTGVRNGRNVHEGYQRGVSLEYGNFGPVVDAHPLYQEALAAATGRSVMATDRIRNLFLILTTFLDRLPSQNCIEFGSYRGGSILFMATVLAKLYPNAVVYSFDTFEGMPTTDTLIDLHGAGDFKDTSLEEIKDAASSQGLANIRFIKGLVQDTFPAAVDPAERFGLAHIDLDIYHAIRHCQDNIWKFMAPGGYVVYDDATASSCIGATQAVEELIVERNMRSEQIYPHFVFRAGLL